MLEAKESRFTDAAAQNQEITRQKNKEGVGLSLTRVKNVPGRKGFKNFNQKRTIK